MNGRASARPKLVEPSGFDTPARADLALAIAARGAAHESLIRLQAAEFQFWTAYTEVSSVVTAAEEALQRAQEASAAYRVASAIGDAAAAPMTITAARAALVDAQDELATAGAAQNNLAGRIAAATTACAAADATVRAAAMAVLRESPAVSSLLDDVLRLQVEAIYKGRGLSWLISSGVLPGGDAPFPIQATHEHYALVKTSRFMDALPVNTLPGRGPGDYSPMSDHPGALVWHDALAALEQDATAPIPGTPAP